MFSLTIFYIIYTKKNKITTMIVGKYLSNDNRRNNALKCTNYKIGYKMTSKKMQNAPF